MAGNRTLKLNILAETKDLVDGLNKANKEVGDAGSKMGETFKKVGVAVAAAAAAAGAFAVKFGVEAVKSASDLSETIAKTGEIFGDSAKQVEAFAESAAATLGQSKQQALDAASTFAIFGRSAGLSGDELVKFSTDFTVLASDLASFNNTSPEDAIQAIGAALRGEAEPLRRYGVLLDDASLRQAALELGIVSTTKNALTPQQKVLAAQQLIFEQTGVAQGDFARTSDGLANSQRILAAQIENVKTSIGTALLPVATELFQFIGSQLIPLITRFSDEFSKNAAPAIETLRAGVGEFLLPALRNLWGFISEFIIPTIRNILTPVIEILQAAFGFLSQKVAENRQAFETAAAIMQALFGFVRDYLAPVVGNVLATAFNLITRAIGLAIDNFGRVFEIIRKVANFLGFDLSLETEKAKTSTNNLDSGIVDAYKSFQEQSRTVKDEVIPGLGQLDLANDRTVASLDKVTAASARTTEQLKQQFTAAQALDLIRSGFGAAVSGGAGLYQQGAESIRSKAELISQAGGFLQGFNTPGDPYFGFGKGSDIRTFKPGQGNVTINVNGTVLDPEGTARAIQDVLQNSAGRAGNLTLGALLGIE
jgi:hypothetical protein